MDIVRFLSAMSNYALFGERLMKHRCGAWLPLLAALALASACQVGPPTAQTPTPRPSASAHAPADPQRCDRLAKRGFTPCPPTPDRMPLPPTTIRNATNGAVSDATAQLWGRAFQLTEAYYRWALQANARGALTSGVLSEASPQAVGNLFGTDLMDLDDAKQAGGVLVYEPPSTPVAQVVPIPPNLQDAMRRQGLTPAAYGLAVRFMGPTRRTIRQPSGSETVVIVRDSAFQADGLVWGVAKSDPDLGSIWYEQGSYGCQGSVRDVCRL
jgi:hypothetical protein